MKYGLSSSLFYSAVLTTMPLRGAESRFETTGCTLQGGWVLCAPFSAQDLPGGLAELQGTRREPGHHQASKGSGNSEGALLECGTETTPQRQDKYLDWPSETTPTMFPHPTPAWLLVGHWRSGHPVHQLATRGLG